jgi:hypothetical protein
MIVFDFMVIRAAYNMPCCVIQSDPLQSTGSPLTVKGRKSHRKKAMIFTGSDLLKISFIGTLDVNTIIMLIVRAKKREGNLYDTETMIENRKTATSFMRGSRRARIDSVILGPSINCFYAPFLLATYKATSINPKI